MSTPRQYEIYSWEPSLSPHKIPLLSALSRREEVSRVTYVSAEGLSDERVKQGWQLPLTSGLEVIEAPRPDEVERIVSQSGKGSIHLFSGVHWLPMLKTGLASAIKHGRTFGLMTEPRVFEFPGGFARLAHSWLTEGRFRRHASFVLAIGRNGPPWFRSAGYPTERVFPFAYFVPLDRSTESPARDRKSPVVGYLGRLDSAKGIHLLLESLPNLRHQAKMIVAGTGELRSEIEAAAASGQLSYRGPIPMTQIATFLSEADIICAPSITTNDGWCAVVGEALMSGAVVLTTPKTGASICIEQDSRLGLSVPPNSLAVATGLNILLEKIEEVRSGRTWRQQWANQRLTPEAGADYLIAIFNYILSGGDPPKPYFL